MASIAKDEALAARSALPTHLRVLADAFPRTGWEGHENFDDLTRFWLDRHLMFRDLLNRLQTENQAMQQGDMDPEQFVMRTARLTGFFLNQLHGHHTIEDQHYFPKLITMDARLAHGFDLLDADHHTLDAHIHDLATASDFMLKQVRAGADRSAAAPVHDQLTAFAGFLNRHLEDEEELVVPLILQYGGPEIGL